MLNEFLQDQSALYAAGAMTASERAQFELLLEFHHELREFVDGLLEVGAMLTLSAPSPAHRAPSPNVKERLSAMVTNCPQHCTAEGLVVCGPDRRVQWVNPAFSEMCGYTLEELRGRSLGPLLQGEKTDREVAERMRRAVHQCRPCSETILNYHKNGSPYWVEVKITPFLDEAGQTLWLIARERELKERAAA